MSRGRAGSEEAVPSTMNNSSRRYLRNFQTLMPLNLSSDPSTINTNAAQVPNTHAISQPRDHNDPGPNFARVYVVVPNAASGASRTIIPTIFISAPEIWSSAPTTAWFDSPNPPSAMPKSTENS